MYLAFYKVENSCDYGRNEFDGDNPELIREKLSRLHDDEYTIYDMSCKGYGTIPSPNVADFVEDYNDECLDGGWWCVVLE